MEGHDYYSNLAGNFDGQGLSFGIIQFNFGQGTLAPMLREYIDKHKSQFVSIFGSTKAQQLENVVKNYSRSQQIAWGDSISVSGNKSQVKPEWATPFKTMGTKMDNQNIQRKHSQQYIDRALTLAGKFNIKSTQGLAFLFDQAVHEWSFSVSDDQIANEIRNYENWYYNNMGTYPSEYEKLYYPLKYVRTTAGKNRRSVIREGKGTINGKTYRASDFQISYNERF